jgi:hypothetical protein
MAPEARRHGDPMADIVFPPIASFDACIAPLGMPGKGARRVETFLTLMVSKGGEIRASYFEISFWETARCDKHFGKVDGMKASENHT